jgi:hypothetical protein
MFRGLAVLLLALPVASFAQEPDEELDEPVPPRVRLALTEQAGLPKRLVGEVVDENPWSLTVRAGGRDVVVDRAFIRRLDVSLGARSLEQGMVRGAVIGLGIGAIAGAAAGFSLGGDEAAVSTCPYTPDAPCGLEDRLSARDKAVIGGSVFGLVGGIMGGAVGMVWPGEAWQRHLPGGPVLAVRLQPRGLGAQLSLRF